MTFNHTVSRYMLIATCSLVLCACQKKHPSAFDESDPFEGANRVIFKANKLVDSMYIKPASRAYDRILPLPAKSSVSNALRNVGEVPTIANDMLQGKISQAMHDTLRLGINSTLGLFGLFDVASPMGLKRNKEDFGKTLYAWGWQDSSYVVLPLLGPSTVRDTFGLVGNTFMSPPSYLNPKWRNRYYLVTLLDRRTTFKDLESVVGAAGIEHYSLVRSGFYQHRYYDITGGAAVIDESDDDFLGEPPD